MVRGRFQSSDGHDLIKSERNLSDSNCRVIFSWFDSRSKANSQKSLKNISSAMSRALFDGGTNKPFMCMRILEADMSVVIQKYGI